MAASNRKYKTFDTYFQEQMNDPEFRRHYETQQPEFDIIRALVDARASRNMKQKELAEKVGMSQADISKIENGTRNPSLNMLKKLADGMDMNLRLEFIPKDHH